mmetsp:Transcript_25615/g.59496  ORF Transcript_25615/g.59496 Transcript_25615/m.59496 type:complete len:114 (-) Transcript_25615:1272-1613(-)
MRCCGGSVWDLGEETAAATWEGGYCEAEGSNHVPHPVLAQTSCFQDHFWDKNPGSEESTLMGGSQASCGDSPVALSACNDGEIMTTEDERIASETTEERGVAGIHGGASCKET